MAAVSDRNVAGILFVTTGIVEAALDIAEFNDPLGVKRATFAAPTDDDSPIAVAARLVVHATDAWGSPGTHRWESWDLEQRTDWWIDRVGGIGTVLVAAPGLYGAIAGRLQVQDVLGFALQAVIICGVQRVHGVHDRYAQTDQLAAVLCDRVIDSAALLADSSPAPAADEREDETTEPGTDIARSSSLVVSSPAHLARATWHVVTLLRGISDELTHRPSPSRPWRILGALPVVGALADYVGERQALRRAADAATASLRAPVRV